MFAVIVEKTVEQLQNLFKESLEEKLEIGSKYVRWLNTIVFWYLEYLLTRIFRLRLLLLAPLIGSVHRPCIGTRIVPISDVMGYTKRTSTSTSVFP